MGVAGAIQVRLFSPRPTEATVNSSTLPAYVAAMRSMSIMMATGEDLFVIKPRVAEPLGIRDGDNVKVELVEVGETVTLKVKIKDGITSDVLIHDLFSLEIGKSYQSSMNGDVVTLKSGRELRIPIQEMWAGIRIINQKGSATLHFDGASRNNPNGPAGYGFHIKRDDNGDELIRGYGYAGTNRTSNEMEYTGLLEGLVWATRLDLKKLTIKGDSELIIRQMKGEYQVREPRLQALYAQAMTLVQQGAQGNLLCEFQHIPRDDNTIADCLANLGIDTGGNVVACNWTHVNNLMRSRRN
jgi:ribonuclease HI